MRPPSEDFLSNTTLYSVPFATGSFAIGNIPVGLTFMGIGGAADALKTILYSDTKSDDFTKQGLKFMNPTPPPFDILTDPLIIRGYDIHKESLKKTK